MVRQPAPTRMIDALADTASRQLTDATPMIDWLAESASEMSLEDNRFEFQGRYTPRGDRWRQRLLSADVPTIVALQLDLRPARTGPVESMVDILTAER